MIKIDKYNGIELEEYNGKHFLNLMGIGKKSEKWFKKWAFEAYQENDKLVPGDKARPIKIPLGDRNQAVEVLRKLLEEIGGSETDMGPVEEIPEDDIPF